MEKRQAGQPARTGAPGGGSGISSAWAAASDTLGPECQDLQGPPPMPAGAFRRPGARTLLSPGASSEERSRERIVSTTP